MILQAQAPKISIIIPIFNEEGTIGKLLSYLTANSLKENIAQIIVIDGGSTDKSIAIAKAFKTNSAFNIVLASSPKGRAKQMNCGAELAIGSILYFLHADSFPPINFDQHIINETLKNNSAGCFKMKFDSNHWWLKLMGWFTQFSWQSCRGGDQSLFISKQLFTHIGGFDESFTVYEDNDLIEKLYKLNTFVVIPKTLTTSSRRYKHNGIWKLQYHFIVIYLKKWLGASAKDLNDYYLSYIK